MIGTYFIIIAVLIGLAFIGLGISTFFGKKKKFPDTHIGKNKAMRERGISCAATTDRKEVSMPPFFMIILFVDYYFLYIPKSFNSKSLINAAYPATFA